MRIPVADLIGKRFGKLVVTGAHDPLRPAILVCTCDCGNQRIMWRHRLLSGERRSCGCARAEFVSIAKTKHGGCGSKIRGTKDTIEYKSWRNMIDRCYNEKNKQYADYGGRGIYVSEEWLNSFNAFISDMGDKPSKKHTIDRIDNDGPYCKENCRWATRTEQCNNKRTNHRIEHDGRVLSVAQWARHAGIPVACFRDRIKRGWDIAKALTVEVRQ